MMKLKNIALQEAEAEALSLKAKADQAEILKVQLAEAHNTSERLERTLSETRSGLTDLEIAVDKITPLADHVWETRVAKVEWVAATLKDLQMRLSYYESKAESLITDLTTVSNEKEVVLQKLQDVSLKCKQLETITAEDASRLAAQESEIENLQAIIVTMEAEAAQHIKMQHAVGMAIGVLNSSGQVNYTIMCFVDSSILMQILDVLLQFCKDLFILGRFWCYAIQRFDFSLLYLPCSHLDKLVFDDVPPGCVKLN